MFRSSTSSSDPPARWRKVALVALLVLVAAEVMLRLPVIDAAIGPPSIYYHPEVQERLDALDAVRAEHGRIDVLFVGSSVARSNINPLVFDAEAEAAGRDVVSFTAGLAGMTIDPARLYLERLLLEEVRPAVVVQVVRYEVLTEVMSADEFFPFFAGKHEELWLSDSPLAPLQEAVLERSRLIQFSGLLTGVLTRPDSALVLGAVPVDERGHTPTSAQLVNDRRPTGEIPGGNTVEQGFSAPVEAAAFDEGFAALAETIAVVRRHGAEYVLVNMPAHREMFLPHPQGEERYRLYVSELRAFAADQGVPFVDPTLGDLNTFGDDDLWANYLYFTAEGAEALTRRLAAAFMGDDTITRFLSEGR